MLQAATDRCQFIVKIKNKLVTLEVKETGRESQSSLPMLLKARPAAVKH